MRVSQFDLIDLAGSMALGLVLVVLVGCGGGDSGDVVPTVSVKGQLLFRGQPLEYHQVACFPEDGQRMAIGVSDEQGRFVLGTNGEGDGAVEGRHRVAISYVGPPNDDPEFGMNDFSNPPPPKVKIPAKYGSHDTSGIELDIPKRGTDDLVIRLD